MLAGQVIVGACVSFTLTVKVQVVSGLFGLASEAVQVTVVIPTGKNDPEAGEHEAVAPEQLSVGVGVVYVTTAPHWFRSFDRTMFCGQVIAGACVSCTVIVKVQVVSGLFGLASEAVQVTVVTPTWKVEPDAGKHEAVAPGQLSVGVGVV